MANYCGCKLTIQATNLRLIEELIEIASPPKPTVASRMLNRFTNKQAKSRDYGLLGFFHPMPKGLKATITNGFSGEAPAWHHWMVENWGCAYDVAVNSVVRKSENEVEFKFDSRYSPPLPAIAHGSQVHGFQFRLVYCESGGQFAGIATEREHQDYEFTFDVHPQEEGVPQEIIDEFDLEAIYHEIKEDKGS